MIIAQITVYSCNDGACDAVFVARTDEDIETMAESWFAGMTLDFCQSCKGKPEHADGIAEEERRFLEMQDGIKSCVVHQEIHGH